MKCHNVHRDFYNEDSCTLSYLPTACAPDAAPKELIDLDDATIAGIRSLTGRLLYAVVGLTLSTLYDEETGFDAPCADTLADQWSRWIKDASDTTCENVAGLSSGTYELYQRLIEGNIDVGNRNEDIVDINRDNLMCDAADQGKKHLGKVATLDGACWHHVHPSERDVFDLTGADTNLYTVTGSGTALVESMAAFEIIAADHAVIGKLGDRVEIDNSLPSPLNDAAVRASFTTLEYNSARKPVLMCGSPDEVASDPFYGERGFDVVAPESSGWRDMSRWELSAQKHTIWTHAAMHAADQLRMRAAWALSQVVSVGLPDEKAAHDFEKTEPYLAVSGRGTLVSSLVDL